MPDLPADPVAVELLVRSALVALCGGIVGLPNIVAHAVYISGEQEFSKKFGVQLPVSGTTEYRVLFIIFIGFEDTDEGRDDAPVYKLVYLLRLVISLHDRRSDGTNSTDDFARLVLTLRQRTLAAGPLAGYAELQCEPLLPTRSEFGPGEAETGLVAHSIDLTLKVEVRPQYLC